MYKVHLLPAAYGDGILIEYGTTDPKYILIDGGPYYNVQEMATGLKKLAPDLKRVELLVITHIDTDHIDGIVTLLNSATLPFEIGDLWFNGFKQIEPFDDLLGSLQGEYISALIKKKKIPHNLAFNKKAVYVADPSDLPVIKLPGGMELTLLSPTGTGLSKLHKKWVDELKKYGDDPNFLKKLGQDKRYESDDDLLGLDIERLNATKVKGDTAAANGSSIAFIATYAGKSCLFAGDATSDYLLPSIQTLIKRQGGERLRLTAWKCAHHGSKKSNLDKLMQKIDCKNMLISTNGAKFKHPDQECIAKLIKNNGPKVKLHFNYETEFTIIWKSPKLQTKYDYTTLYPKNKTAGGISIKLA